MTYLSPTDDKLIALKALGDLDWLGTQDRYADADLSEMVKPILEESGRQAAEIFAPLNWTGDQSGAKCSAEGVAATPGFAEAYTAFCDSGWNGLSADAEFGGQQLPFVLACAAMEDFHSANAALTLCPMLTQGAIEALTHHGSDDQKAIYLKKLVSGEWTGTMNLTEPQAGSDVGAIRSVGRPIDDGSYRIKGQKIFISWGDHDLAPNIVHLVLARLPDAPAGSKGLSLFIVPKLLVDDDGSLGGRNDVRAVSIEHKMGLHGSPTCVMTFGDDDNCVGYLVGEPNGGLKTMFTMMNHARINVGLEGVGVAERALQAAREYAETRIQARAPGQCDVGPIKHHPDVRRMLDVMDARTSAARAIVYRTAAAVDKGRLGDESEQALADLMTPLAKSYGSQTGADVADLGVQVHGGLGYVEETGAAQHFRDARVFAIYEGTNGVQAMDLVIRKLPRRRWEPLFDAMASQLSSPAFSDIDADVREELAQGILTARCATGGILALDPEDAAYHAAPYLELVSNVIGMFLLAQQFVALRLEKVEGLVAPEAALESSKRRLRTFADILLPASRGAEFAIVRKARSSAEKLKSA